MNKAVLQKSLRALVLLALFAAALIFLPKSQAKQAPALQIDTTNQPTRGNPNAKVHIVVFEDLKCIACKNFNNTVLPQIKKQFIDTNIAKYTVINLAFIPGSMPGR